MNKTGFRVEIVNSGKYGYGFSTWEALVNAVGMKKAGLISDQYSNNSPVGRWYSKNNVLMAIVEYIQETQP